jgi:uroporphyrinogen-III decarboxylase
MEYMVKEPKDLKKLLSINYEPFQIQTDDYYKKITRLGDRGVVMFGVEHAAYALHRLIGSENLAYFSVDYRNEVQEILKVFSERIRLHVNSAIEAGVKGPFQWVGPELFIPPLMSPRDFDDFVYKYDKPLCDDIHNAGGFVWLHCHGKVSNFIERYISMGVDILNPLEPPKNGDVVLKDVVEKFGNRIGLEGNIEIQDIIQSEPKQLKELINSCVEEGNKSGRFILCPSAGFMEYPKPSKQYIENLLLYLNYGYECVEGCRK